MSLCFQVTHVRKPLLAVKRITEKGNVIQFCPAESHDYIKNKLSGNKILLRKKGEVIHNGRFVCGKWGGSG